jgi:hypothetical protein
MLNIRQKKYINETFIILQNFLSSKSQYPDSTELMLRNKNKTFIGIDYNLLENKRKGLELDLFFGHYKSTKENDILDALDSCKSQKIIISKKTNVSELYEIFTSLIDS